MKPVYQAGLEKGMEHAAAAAAERALGPPTPTLNTTSTPSFKPTPNANGKHKTLWCSPTRAHTRTRGLYTDGQICSERHATSQAVTDNNRNLARFCLHHRSVGSIDSLNDAHGTKSLSKNFKETNIQTIDVIGSNGESNVRHLSCDCRGTRQTTSNMDEIKVFNEKIDMDKYSIICNINKLTSNKRKWYKKTINSKKSIMYSSKLFWQHICRKVKILSYLHVGSSSKVAIKLLSRCI